MSHHCSRMVAALVWSAMMIVAPIATPANDVKQEMNAAVEAVRPALIRIRVVSADYREGRESKMESAGSGVIISPDGYAVTNDHVAMDAKRLFCTLADKREVEAKLIGEDPLSDIAVIKLIPKNGQTFPTAKFGDSSKLEVGDRVFAMGSPYALSQSVTMGIVSNTELIMPDIFGPDDKLEMEGEDVGSIVRWIGHDALIAPGNSGGPLVSPDGEIVGINEIEMGLSGAIPGNLVKDVAAQLIKNGKIMRSWLGLEVQPLLKSATSDKGILVSGVLQGSPAEKAGLKSGDVITLLDGQPVSAQFREQVPIFNQFVAGLPVGKSVAATVLRDGKEVSLTVVTAERPKAMDKEHEVRSWGICGSDITLIMQKEMELDSQDGVVVTSVLPSGPAGSAKPPLKQEDVITSVDGESIGNLAALRAVSKKLTEERAEAVPAVVNFRRGEKQYATVVRIGKKEDPIPATEVTKAWLPVDMQVLTNELAQGLGVPGKTGVRITRVYPGSTADKAGLKVGDLLVKLDGEPVPAEQVGDEEVLPGLIRQYDIGATVKFGVIRDGKALNIDVKLQASPKPSWDYPKYEDELFGLTARDIAFSDRSGGAVKPGQNGAYVDSVSEGSWAALGNLCGGDVITQINGTAITDLAGLKQAMSSMAEKQPATVVMKIRRGIHTMFLEIKPDWTETQL